MKSGSNNRNPQALAVRWERHVRRPPLEVLVVEDEIAGLALDIENMLEEMGCTVVASVPRLAEALDLAARLDLDLAVLDINLAGEVVYPSLPPGRARHSFLFSTGYSTRRTCRSSCAIVPSSGKPVMPADLKRAVAQARTGIRSVN